MRVLKSTLETSWKTIYNLKLVHAPAHMWYTFYAEHCVCAGLNLIDAFEYVLDNHHVPDVFFEDLTKSVARLKRFYNE